MTKPLALSLASAALCLAPALHAQTSVYGSVGIADYGYKVNSPDFLVYRARPAFGAGTTVLFLSQSRLKAGIDARFSGSPGTGGGVNAIAAVRFAFVPHQVRVSPYFQIGGGLASTTYPTYTVVTSGFGSTVISSRTRLTGGLLSLAAGLNVRVNDKWSIRAFDLSSSAGTKVGTAGMTTGVIYTF